jgi:hypothetical protein
MLKLWGKYLQVLKVNTQSGAMERLLETFMYAAWSRTHIKAARYFSAVRGAKSVKDIEMS